MVLAYAVPGVLAPLPSADGRGQRYHAGAAWSARCRVPAASQIQQRAAANEQDYAKGSSREHNVAPAQINLIWTVTDPHELDPEAAPNGGSGALSDKLAGYGA